MRTFYIVDMLTNPVKRLVKFIVDQDTNEVKSVEKLVDTVPYELSKTEKLSSYIMHVYERTQLLCGNMRMCSKPQMEYMYLSTSCCKYAIVNEEYMSDSSVTTSSCWYWAVPIDQLVRACFARVVSSISYADIHGSASTLIKPDDVTDNYFGMSQRLKEFYRQEVLHDKAYSFALFSILITASITWPRRIGYLQDGNSKFPAMEYVPMEAFSAIPITKELSIVDAANCLGVDIERLVKESPWVKDLSDATLQLCNDIHSVYQCNKYALHEPYQWINNVCTWIKCR